MKWCVNIMCWRRRRRNSRHSLSRESKQRSSITINFIENKSNEGNTQNARSDEKIGTPSGYCWFVLGNVGRVECCVHSTLHAALIFFFYRFGETWESIHVKYSNNNASEIAPNPANIDNLMFRKLDIRTIISSAIENLIGHVTREIFAKSQGKSGVVA